MKKNIYINIVASAALLFGAVQTVQATTSKATPGALDWTEKYSWQLSAKPLDFVHSLDNKKVFVLGADAKVHIYSAEGEEMGSLPVSPDVTAIDIAPRGETLYAVDAKTKTFTAYDISFVQNIDVTGSPFIGNADAPVVLAVFSDFQ